MKLSSRLKILALSAALLAALAAPAMAAEQVGFTLGIYSTAGMYGRCFSLDPLTGEEAEGGYLKVGSAMAREREDCDAVLLLDVGGLPREDAALSQAAAGENAAEDPTALCLRQLGYDAHISGALPYGREARKAFSALLSDDSGSRPGPAVAVLEAEGDTPYLLRDVAVGEGTFRVGVLALGGGDGTPDFCASEWTDRWQRELREERECDFVILCVPFQAGSGEPDGGDPIGRLVQSTAGIDLVIAGQGGASGERTLQNAQGQPVRVVGGGDCALTKTTLTIRADGSFTWEENRLLALRDFEDDPALAEGMARPYEQTAAYVNKKIGALNGGWDQVTDFSRVQSDSMDLIHEAQLWASGADVSLLFPAAREGFCVSQLLGRGGVGTISLKDCRDLCPDGGLSMVELTGGQLKTWLERCAADYSVTQDGTVEGGDPGAGQLYGISYDIFLNNSQGQRVQNMTYQGSPVTDSQVFKVVVPSALLSADVAPDSGAVLWSSGSDPRFEALGGSVTGVLAEYIKAVTAQGRALTPPEARSHWRIYATTRAEGASKVTRRTLAEVLYAHAGYPAVEQSDALSRRFSDFPAGGSAALTWACDEGILQGTGDGKLLPDTLVTREQAAAMLLRYDISRGKGPLGFWAVALPYTDAAAGSTWAAESLMWNVTKGYLTADESGAFRPQDSLTVSQLFDLLPRLG